MSYLRTDRAPERGLIGTRIKSICQIVRIMSFLDKQDTSMVLQDRHSEAWKQGWDITPKACRTREERAEQTASRGN